MTDPDPTVASLVDALEAFLRPVTAASESEFQREQLVEAIGGDLDQLDASDEATLEAALNEIVTSFEAIETLLQDSPSSMDLLSVLGETADVFVAIADVQSALSGTPLADVAGALVDYLVMRYLASEHPALIQAAYLLTIVRVHETDSGEFPPEFYSDFFPQMLPEVASFELNRVGDLLSDPVGTLSEVYLDDGQVTPQSISVVAQYLLPGVQTALGKLGFDCAQSFVSDPVSNVDGHPDLTVIPQYLSVRREGGQGQNAVFGFDLAFGVNDGRPAVVVVPYGSAEFEFTSDAWKISLGLTGQVDVVVVDADGLSAEGTGGSVGEVGFSGRVARGDSLLDTPPARIGSAGGTRFEVGDLGLEGGLTGDPASGTFDANVLASAEDANLTVAPGDGDGFVQQVLPKDGLSLDFSAGVGYATSRGLYFEGGGAGLEADLPIGFSIADVLTVETLHLAATPDTSGETVSIPVEVSASPQVQLGPVGATVEQIGLQADVTFPERSDGNLGPLNVDIGFEPPSGAGLAVDASAVGGGYLSFDPENQRYSGTLQLTIGSLTLNAVGLLTTQLPDGRDGFSLLVIITGEFPPVQLGFGFTLNGLGGLLGVNRGTKVEALRAGLRDGTTKSILFPKDPMRNAPRIVSDLRRVFPPTRARHVFGPMAKLGWGTPTIMTAELGVLVSLPAPVTFVMLGRLHAALPDDEAALVVFNVDAIGVVDFGAKEASIDATLYDSRIVAYTLTGDMAMRTNWGEDPDFALSVGGFHPKFDPPEGFPELRRIALTLGPGNPRIRWSGYFAITSNTVQAGAKVELYARAAGFALSGHLGFDALFQFDPFKLLVDIAAGFAVKRGGTTLLSVQLRGSLKGPNPWHVRGKASFEIWPLSFSVNVDATFGERSDPEPLPPADVLGELTKALGDERNWSAQLPENGDSVVTLREIERSEGTVLAHPLGTLGVRQQVVPLNVHVEKFGNARPANYSKFTIASVTVSGQSEDTDAGELREEFAPAQFLKMSDSEKLSAAAFEKLPAGTEVGNSQFAHGGQADGEADQMRTVELAYETSVVDRRRSPFPMAWKRLAMPQTTASALTDVSAVARGPLRTTGTAKFDGTDAASGPTGVQESVSVSDLAYVVARDDDLRQVDVPGVPSTGTTRRETTEALDEFLAADGRGSGAYRVVASHEATGPEVQP